MVSKFDSKDYAKQRLFNICVKYFPKEHLKINSGRKGFRLGESTNELINQSRAVINRTKETNDPIPESTANIFRYGTKCQEIFEDLSSYQMISQLKARSRRGYRKELEVVDFDLKKIDLEFKKSPNPSVKTLKDEKFIRNAQKLYLKLLNEDNHPLILKDVMKNQELFIVVGSNGKKFFDSLFRLLNALVSKNTEKIEHETLLEQKQIEIANKSNRLQEIETELPAITHQIELYREKSGIQGILSEKEQLFSDPDLSLFLKTLTNGLERYMKMMERRESRDLEQKEDFLNLILDPTRFQGLDEELWRQIVFIIETHGFELLSGKKWFMFEDPSELRQFMVRKNVLEKFAHLRTIEKQLNEIEIQLQNDPNYSKAQKKIQKFDETSEIIVKIRKELLKIEEKVASLSQELEADKEKVVKFLY